MDIHRHQPPQAATLAQSSDNAPLQHRTLTIMPFEDDEEERLWDEIVALRSR